MSLTSSSVFLFATNFCLVCLTCYWAVSAWRRLHVAHTQARWEPSICTITSTTLLPVNGADAGAVVKYCPLLMVSANFSDMTIIANSTPSAVQPDAALPGEPGETCSTNATLLTTFLNANFPVGRVDQCWVAAAAPHPVAYEDLTEPVGRDKFNIVAISTVVSISAVLSLAAVMFLIFMPFQPLPMPEPFLGVHGSPLFPDPLPPFDIDGIITAARAADAASPKDIASEDRMCAICLEDGLGARLPCGHAYHPECIKKWLLRGSDTCPLCLAVVTPPVTPSTESPHTDACFSSAPTSPMEAPNSLQVDLPLTAMSDLPSDMNASVRILPPIGRRTFHRRVPVSPPHVIRLPAPPPPAASPTNRLTRRPLSARLRNRRAPIAQSPQQPETIEALDDISVPNTISDMQVASLAPTTLMQPSNMPDTCEDDGDLPSCETLPASSAAPQESEDEVGKGGKRSVE